MGGRKFFVTVVAIFSLLFMSLPVYAGYYSDVVEAEDIGGTASNPYGITIGTEVRLYYAEPGTVSVDFIGTSASFDQGDKVSLKITEDAVTGKLTELLFATPNWELDGDPAGYLSINEGGLGSALDHLRYSLDGNSWGISGSLTYTEIPIPGAIWLLGSGMIGLAGLRKRFRTSE